MLNLSKIGLHFGERTLFEDLSLAVGAKDRLGLVGRNGAGKTTLLKIIAGEQKPSEGTVSMPKDYRIGYLPQEMTHNEEATILEEAQSAFSEFQDLESRVERLGQELATRTDYESDEYSRIIDQLSDDNDRLALLGQASAEEQTQRVLQGLGFAREDMGRKMSEFSGGWKMRVELSKLLLMSPNLMLLDEPTNHLDIESIEWLEGFLKSSPSSIILISHDRTFLDVITNRTVEISTYRTYDHKASYSKYIAWRAEDMERQQTAYKAQQKEIAHMQELINKFRAKKNKAAFAQSLIKKLEKMERIEVDVEENAAMRFRFPPAPRSGKVVFEAKQLKKSFGDLDVFENVDLMIARQEKLALVGKNGAGKTTLTRILLGVEAAEGEVEKGHNVDVGYYAQNQSEELNPELTVFETIDGEAVGDVRKRVRALLGSFLFSGEDVEKKVRVLSGGEKARLALCKLMLHPYNVLVLDEPTNHLDMKAKDVLKKALMDFDGTLIVVSHDRDFLTGMTELVYEVTPTGLRQYIGDIQEFLAQKRTSSIAEYEADRKAKKKEQAAKSGKGDGDGEKLTGKQVYEQRKERQRNERKLKNRIGKREKEIAAFEEKLAELNAEVTAAGGERKSSVEMAYAYEKVQRGLDEAMADWEEATEALDQLNA
jgi:ATP-binding cassette, subfamily F, member 3